MESLYQTFLQTFGGTPLLERFLRIERREDEDDAMDVLEDFWADHREPWMHVANEDARARLKTIRVGTEVLVMAEIHRKIALSNINLTGVASRILKVPNPCVYAVSRMLDNVTGPSDDDAMMWNLPAANDVLDHLIHVKPGTRYIFCFTVQKEEPMQQLRDFIKYHKHYYLYTLGIRENV